MNHSGFEWFVLKKISYYLFLKFLDQIKKVKIFDFLLNTQCLTKIIIKKIKNNLVLNIMKLYIGLSLIWI